jgi:hypothetical protein
MTTEAAGAVAVVGGGRCGLIAGRALATTFSRAVLVERLPGAGGQEPDPDAERLTVDAAASGLEFQLGTLAVRWDGEVLSTLGVEGAAKQRFDALVIAAGARPATRAELEITGDRGAGILPGTAALHMIDSGVLPGRHPVVLGGGSLAGALVESLKGAGARQITVVAPDGVLNEQVRACDRLLERWNVLAALGTPRVQRLTIAPSGGGVGTEQIFADALLLAHRRLPMRNVEGAIGRAPGVVYCQTSTDPKTPADAEACARRAVSEVRAVVDDRRRES